MSSLQAKIDKQTNEPKPKIEKVDISRSEVSFKFELANVSKVYAINKSLGYGDRFWCRGMQWSIYVKNNFEINQFKPLGLFLRCHNDDPSKWSCHAVGKLILFNSSKNHKRTWPFDHTFTKNGQYFWGQANCLSYSDITD